MVDQTKVINPLMLMLNVQELHGDHITSRQDLNSESPEKVGFKEELEVYGDHSPHTTSGITTMVLKLFVKTSDMVRV